MKSRRQIALDNLTLVYANQKTAGECRQLARKNFAHLGGTLLETLHAVARPGSIPAFVHQEGGEHLRAALAKNRGAVVFSAHFGNFLMLPAALNEFGVVKFLFRDPSNSAVSDLYRRLREPISLGVIADNPRHLCAFHAYAHLKAKGILGVLVDQVETGGLYVDFLGHPAGSTLGAANLALKSGAPLVPVFCSRQPNSTLKVTIEPEFVCRREGKMPDLVRDAVAGMNQVVETWVRAYPEQWFWGHRRWRQWRK